jgi:hypothetical protein
MRRLARTFRLASFAAMVASPLAAQPRLTIAPQQPVPGAIVRVTLRGARAPNDSIV